MQTVITIDGKTYSNFSIVHDINEAEDYDVEISFQNNAGVSEDFTSKTVTAKLCFVKVTDTDTTFDIEGTIETAASGIISFPLKDELTGKGYNIYNVYARITIDGDVFNIYSGRLIITKDYCSA